MVYTSPAVVIDNGSYTTKAGFALEDLPSLVFNSNYLVNAEGKVVVGDDEMALEPTNEVMTLMDNGLVYNYDNILHNWQYVYDNIDNNNGVDPKEYPLMLTEQAWNTTKNKLTTSQIVFETLEVPIFSLVKTPLAQLYRVGKSTGLVIDIGASVASVTPVLDGIIQNKCAFHSKYAGDFLNLHIMDYFHKKLSESMLLPAKFQSASDSFKTFYISRNILQEYKCLALNYQLQDIQLPGGNHISLSDQTNYLNNLFQPTLNRLPGVTIPEPQIDKPNTHGLTNLILLCLKNLEATLLPNGNESHNKFARFNEIFKGLLSNILITGGTSLATGLADQIVNDLRVLTPKYFPNYAYSPYSTSAVPSIAANDVSETWDRLFSGWLGACNLASMLNDVSEESNSVNIALDNWFVTKADYEELGEDLIVEKFK
jgi:actin-related protein 7